MADFGLLLLMLGVLALYVLPALLAMSHVLRYRQPRVWLLVFLCMPLGGPLLYVVWPRGSASRPWAR